MTAVVHVCTYVNAACFIEPAYMTLQEQVVVGEGVLAGLFLCVGLLRGCFLLGWAREQQVEFHWGRVVKMLVAMVFAALHIAVMLLWRKEEKGLTKVMMSAGILDVAAALLMIPLSWLEDARSVRPSSTLALYLFFTAVLDILQTRLLWLRQDVTLAGAFTAATIVKLLMLTLESRSKKAHLKQAYKNLPPEVTSGIINRSFLWWLNGLFRRGLSSFLTVEDLYQLDDELASEKLSANIQAAWDKRRQPERRFEFPRAAFRALWWPMLKAVFPRACLIVFKFAQPFLITRVLDMLSEPAGGDASSRGYILIGATAVIYLGMALSDLHYNHLLYRLMTMFRGATVGLIYNHMLVLPDGAYDNSAVVTLMSTDVSRIVNCLTYLNECWARLIEVVLGIVLLARQLGWTCVVPMAVVFISFFGSTEISKTIGGRQKTWAAAVQHRITTTASTLASMRSVKMMGLAPLLTATVQKQRVEETQKMASFFWSIVWQNVVQNLPWSVAPALTFTAYVAQALFSGDGVAGFDATKAFTSLSIITLLTHPAAILLSSIPGTAASLGCFDRIQEFLVTKPRVDERVMWKKEDVYTDEVHGDDSTAALFEGASLRPGPSAEVVLQNVDLSIQRGSLTIIVGPVGSGKTTLLRALLGEVSYKGRITVATSRISLCVQTPWLPNTTIRETVSGYSDDEDFDETWYRKCLTACALDQDLDTLGQGDYTKIGSAGTTLSGGQRHRIALARAIYAKADIVLLDDVLSALDVNTQATVMARLFGVDGLLRGGGTTVVMTTHATKYLGYADKILVVDNVRVEDGGTFEEVTYSKLADTLKSNKGGSESAIEATTRKKTEDDPEHTADANEMDDLTRKTGDTAVYWYYFRSVGWQNALLFVGSVFLNVFCNSFSQIWLKWWTDAEGGRIALFMTVYLVLAALTSVGECGYVWTILIRISPSTGRKLHETLLNVVMRAPQSFFSTTDTGSILNRFSQDMTIIEQQLPTGVLIAVSNLFSSIAAAALVTTGSAYMSASIPFLLVIIYTLQHVYLRTSRQLRLLDLEAKSPLYTHFLESMGGLTTIRAFGWQSRFRTQQEALLDYSQRPEYMLYCIQRWLNLVLDLIVGGQAVLVVGLALGWRSAASAGLLGVSLNNILSFSSALSSFVSGYTMLETSLGSIARLMSFEKQVKPEDKQGEVFEPEKNWPERGAVEFHNVTASHGAGAVGIRDVNLIVQPGQKVGICGRTGSGKSSLIGTLLRLLEIDSGTITIDDVDLSTIPRDTIREHLLVIPQDPLILTGSIRLNVDPDSLSTDATITAALHRVGLWSLAESRGLDAEITSSSLSQGQHQLLALARTLVKKSLSGSKVLLLDEATSNVDAETDAVLQQVLREDFVGFTKLVVAHRLDTILDSDMVVVMDESKIVEAGEPDALLARKGWFERLVNVKG